LLSTQETFFVSANYLWRRFPFYKLRQPIFRLPPDTVLARIPSTKFLKTTIYSEFSIFSGVGMPSA